MIKHEDQVNELEHHGVKGQKWGVTRVNADGSVSGTHAQNKAAKAAHKEWKKGAMSGETGKAVFKEASRTMGPTLTKINKDPTFKDYPTNRKTRQQYDAVVNTIFNQHMAQASLKITGKSFGGKVGTRAVIWDYDHNTGLFRPREFEGVAHDDMVDDDTPPTFKAVVDEDGMVVDIKWFDEVGHAEVAEFLNDFFIAHHGVKGQKWGVRMDHETGTTRKTSHEAKKDAKEFARAKLFYGEGAGTRRKLIKATVESKSKHDPNYKKAFDHHLANQDLGTHAEKARGERNRKDRSKATKQVGGSIARKFTGEQGTKAAFTVAAVGGLAFLNSPKGRAVLKTSASHARDFAKKASPKSTTSVLNDFLSGR